MIRKILIGLAVTFVLSLIGAFIFYLACLNHTEINEIGVAYNSLNGEITVQNQPGWYRTSVFTKVAYLSTLPMKVRIPTEAKVIVTKVVSFNPAGVSDFIRLQGFSYQINQGLENILMGYAFSGCQYSFLYIGQESTKEDMEGLRPLSVKDVNGLPMKKDSVKIDTAKTVKNVIK